MPDIFIKPQNSKKETALAPELKNHVGMFSNFLTNPQGVSFVQQQPDEKILLFLKRHLIVNVPWVIITFILLFAPLIIFIFEATFQLFHTLNLPPRFILVFTAFYYLIVFSYAFVNFITWFYNVLLVTQKRVVDIEYHDITIHNIAFTKLINVQDVNYTQAGFIRSFFNYGDVFVQTAGTETHFEGLSIPMPRRAAQIIGDLIGRRAHAA